MNDYLREVGRKTFHMLSLVYLFAYHRLGYPVIIRWMIPWTIVVMVVETGRFYWPKVNDFLFGLMGEFSRPEERFHYSGIVHTTLGAFLLFIVFGDKPQHVSFGLYCVALGDAAAALVGKSIGKHRLFGSKKSIEGSLACWLVCAAAGVWTGFPAGCALAGATVATGVEWLPTSALFNDNLWMPIAVATTARLCAGS